MIENLRDKRIPERIPEYVQWIEHNMKKSRKISKDDNLWIDNQIKFRFGRAYNYIIKNEWDKLYPKTHVRIKRWLCNHDTTYDKIFDAYGKWGEYRHNEALGQIFVYNMLVSAENKSQKVLLPIVMVDTMGMCDVPYWAYNRQVNTQEHILWPLCSHRSTFEKGLADKIEWKNKTHRLVFRGVTTGPIRSFKTRNGIKTSRFEIISRCKNKSWADVGFNKIIDPTKRDTNWKESCNDIKSLLKKSQTVNKMLQNRFILCIEGNDISTSFGWVLASNSVPIHPYPFLYEVWYFQDLRPWVHFIPCKPDGSDIELMMEWAQKNDGKCQRIALQGREYMKRMLDPVLYIEILKRMYDMWKLYF